MTASTCIVSPGKQIGGIISIPGSKSYTNRSLLLAAHACGKSTLLGCSPSTDSQAMESALSKLGVRIEKSDSTWTIYGGSFVPYQGPIDIGPAGTTMRFLVPLCASIPGAVITLQGSERMHQRPIHDLVDALRSLGAQIEYLGTPGCPPLKITGTSLQGGTIEMSGSTSSQFLSSLMLNASRIHKGVQICVHGPQISRSYIEMTLSSLDAFGVSPIEVSPHSYDLTRSPPPSPTRYQVEGDCTGATYFWALAALSGSQIVVRNIPPGSKQGDITFPRLLEQMGCSVEWSDADTGSIAVTGPQRPLTPICTNMKDLPDSAQTLAVVAACSTGTSTLSGLSTLRIKETDRLVALQTELAKVGIRTEIDAESCTIHGGATHSAHIATYEDHRMAMSFALLGARHSITIEEPSVVAKSQPDFWSFLRQVGLEVQ